MRRRCSFWMPDHDHHLSLPTLRHSNISQTTNIGIHTHTYSYSGEKFFWCRYLASRYVDTFIVYSNSKRRPQWNIQSCQQRYGKWIFGNRYNRALWCPPIISKMVTNNAFYRISVLVSSLFIADVSPAHISAQHQSGQIKSKHIHILISNSCSNCKFLAGGTWQRRAGAGDCKWCMESAAEAGIGSLTISSAFWVSVHLSARIFALVFRH